MPTIGKIIKYGLLLYVIWFAVQLVLSMIYRVEDVTDIVSANVIAAVIMTAVAWRMGRKMKLPTSRAAVNVGALWVAISLIVVGLLLAIRQTDAEIFNKWSVYLTYVGMFIGTVLSVRRPSARPTPVPSP